MISRTIKMLKSFKYKSKFFGLTVAKPTPDQANGILKNATIVVRLKYLSNFWRSLEVPLINCKFELKLEWIKHCFFLSVLDVGNNDNNGANCDITFTKKIQYCMSL